MSSVEQIDNFDGGFKLLSMSGDETLTESSGASHNMASQLP